ncbi:hypothetical protein CDAR_572121 [Caerostris darwini]|uniref:Uncharacterized protein n=1 Tax=Caerostris darwini TaxID=1538125 RepID=A0AAV4R9P8_9ARAC|nr:hypothetical protein CDAR_572121 [Caerostris darwini]
MEQSRIATKLSRKDFSMIQLEPSTAAIKMISSEASTLEDGPVALLPISAKPRNYNGRRRDPSGERGGMPRISFGHNHFADLGKLTSLCLCIGALGKGGGRPMAFAHQNILRDELPHKLINLLRPMNFALQYCPPRLLDLTLKEYFWEFVNGTVFVILLTIAVNKLRLCIV